MSDEVQPAKQGEKYVNLSEPHTGLIKDRGQLQFLLHVEIKEFPPIVLWKTNKLSPWIIKEILAICSYRTWQSSQYNPYNLQIIYNLLVLYKGFSDSVYEMTRKRAINHSEIQLSHVEKSRNHKINSTTSIAIIFLPTCPSTVWLSQQVAPRHIRVLAKQDL